MEESSVRNSRIGETREDGERRERKNRSRQDIGRTGDGTNSGYDEEAERIWRETETEEDDNMSNITRALHKRTASLEKMETGSIIGSKFNNRRMGGI